MVPREYVSVLLSYSATDTNARINTNGKGNTRLRWNKT